MGKKQNCTPENNPGFLIGKTFCQRWRVVRLIKHGTTAKIYEGFDLYTKSNVAVKAVPSSLQDGTVDREIMSYKRVHLDAGDQEKRSIPLLHDYGTAHGHAFIVMQLLDLSLTDIWKACEGGLSANVVLSIGDHLLGALQCLLIRGLVHGHISTDNLVLKQRQNTTIVYLIDYGESRLFQLPRSEIRERYSGSPSCDALSLCVLLLSLLAGPEKSFNSPPNNDVHKISKAYQLDKAKHLLRHIDSTLVSTFEKYITHCEQIQNSSVPNYSLLRSSIRQLYWERRTDHSEYYGWSSNPKEKANAPKTIKIYRSLVFRRVRPTKSRVKTKILERIGMSDATETPVLRDPPE